MDMESGSTHRKQKANEGEDIICKLHESLISHILSLLPTKDAVRTSVLSKRWRYRWTSITKLDLDDRVFYSPKKKTGGKQYFINFVYRALLLTKASSLESFSLVIANKYDLTLLNTWISNILMLRRVKNLHIRANSELSFSALTSQSLFNSTFIEELVLEMCCCDIKVPTNYVYFGSLKLVKLRGITFTIDSSSDYLSLILPVLEKFETTNCSWLGAKGVTLKAPLLESICIGQDLLPLSQEPRSCAIKFSDCHLKEFTYCGYSVSQPIILSDPSSAHNACANIILIKWWDKAPGAGLRAFMLFKQFSQAKCIRFDGSEVLTQPDVVVLPVFAMLGHLELGLVTGEVLLGLLQKSPVLVTLVVKGISKFELELLNSTVVLDCLTSTLQVVKFEKVNGYEHELCLAKFFMENGTVLERMSFSLTSQWLSKSKAMEEFKEKLFSFKKGFSFAIVEFSYD